MFLKPKKGNLVAQFVVLIIVAVILIFVVTSFGAKIWQAFFPNADKSTIKSFDAIFNVFNAKAVSNLDYDSTTMNVYFKDGYRMVFFDDGKLECKFDYWGMPAKATYYPPKVCAAGKQCLCLYKKPPIVTTMSDTKAREKNLVKCYSFENHINIDPAYFDMNKVTCTTTKEAPYTSYIFIKRTIYPSKTSYVYVIEDNDANRVLNAGWSVPVCKATDSSNLCYLSKDGYVVNATDVTSLNKIYLYCQNREGVTFKTASVLCEYPPGKDDCLPKCAYGDVQYLCGKTYTSCEDYNTNRESMSPDFAVEYISQDEDYKTYAMCQFDNLFCAVGGYMGCDIKTWNVYACKDSATGTATGGDTTCTPPNSIIHTELKGEKCDVKYLTDLEDKIMGTKGNFLFFITSYNNKNAKCKEYMDKYFFEGQTMMKCKDGMAADCDKFIKDKKITLSSNYECELKFIQQGQMYWLTHYKSSDSQCDKDVKALFTTVSLCRTKTTQSPTVTP